MADDDVLEAGPNDPVPAGYIRCDDGKLYRHRIVAGVTTIALAGSNDPTAAEKAQRAEKAMGQAVLDALDQGIPIDSPEIQQRILAARDAALKGS